MKWHGILFFDISTNISFHLHFLLVKVKVTGFRRGSQEAAVGHNQEQEGEIKPGAVNIFGV